MANRVYVVSEGKLRPLTEAPSRDESQLQSLLSRFPEVLEATELSGGVEHHWLLVQPELGIPSAPESTDRWRADHLLLDQNAVPTVVEVKRSSDTRVRREVVGQMLDYAAAVSTEWSADRIRQAFEDTCQRDGADPSERLQQFLTTGDDESDEPDTEAFWRQVEANLSADRVRMLFVADRIPFELRRIIEFLNKQMSPAEVYGVEIRQYTGQDLEAVVPVVVGETTKRRRTSGSSSTAESTPKSVDHMLETLRQSVDESGTRVAEALMAWARQQEFSVRSHKALGGCISVLVPLGDSNAAFLPFRIRQNGYIRIPLVVARKRPPFDQPEEIRTWLERLNEIAGVDIADQYVHRGAPDIPLQALARDDAFNHFVDTAKWAIQRAQDAHSTS